MHLNKEEVYVLYLILDLIKHSEPVDEKGKIVRWSNKELTKCIKEYARDYLHPFCNKKNFIEKAESVLLYHGENYGKVS